MSKSEHAVEQFRAGANCAQAVLGEYAEERGLDTAWALKIACGFGGGMGRMGHTCGAVTGAIMAIGLVACDANPRSPATKSRVYELVRSFTQEFEARHQSTSCRELLGCDISTPDGYAEANRLELFGTKCVKYVADAVEIIEDLTSDHAS